MQRPSILAVWYVTKTDKTNGLLMPGHGPAKATKSEEFQSFVYIF